MNDLGNILVTLTGCVLDAALLLIAVFVAVIILF
jgi:hypothetical protein